MQNDVNAGKQRCPADLKKSGPDLFRSKLEEPGHPQKFPWAHALCGLDVGKMLSSEVEK